MTHNSSPRCCRLEFVFANLLLRLWVGLRLIMAGLDKFRMGDGVNTTFTVENYQKKMDAIGQATADRGFLPVDMCMMYAKPLGYLLLACGAWAVVGLFTRLGLLACGLLMLSLGLGLATMGDDTEVVYVGVHILIIAAALATNSSNKISLDGLFFRGRPPEAEPIPSAPVSAPIAEAAPAPKAPAPAPASGPTVTTPPTRVPAPTSSPARVTLPPPASPPKTEQA